MKADITKYCNRCIVCCRCNDYYHKRRGLLKPLPVMSDKFVAISCDFITNLKEVEDDNGNVYNQIWVIVDRFSKYVTLIPTHNTYKSEDLYNLFMSNYVKYFCVPREITSDRDSKLTSKVWRTFADKMKVKLNFTSADHQQANGQAEIVIRAIKNTLRKLLLDDKINDLDKNWYEHL
ncbi:hypothetical protein PPL_00772 [Heterostelium album PN500]|uniref:Integrase catalytic domain-containing protein n=1 Tax=Heterostelium pallidum (strain ATCC 26659 / Pp 5 / PN500) TaxID=670386 RepID=D3AXE1_HETP5|nr:hypothetical protein PPL_00772 [Heterostelium album PN500]EFA86210.1 hypothetical protein PPL_00772 [Heterostelium album PN500]|eukprot:XP_020438315.1 hypothetical protein PPL_00772 [Heterostelium album PN500]